MKVIDQPAELRLEESSPLCLRLGKFECAKVICPNITPVDEFGGASFCGRGFFEAIQYELVEVCKNEFFLACAKFGNIVGPICPFDPPRLADKYQLVAQIEELTVKVEELTAKIK